MSRHLSDQSPANSTRAVGPDDVAFASYLGTVAVALLAGMIFVLTLDIEGETKAAATVAFLLPGAALLAIVAYALIKPLGQVRARPAQPIDSAEISPSRSSKS
jgi:predicted lipid-binding transport protein (Tim44 family)